MTNKKLRFGIIGCGIIGDIHCYSTSHLEGAELVAVCDIVEERAAEYAERFNCRYYTDYKEMLQQPDIDIVSICVPSGMHGDIGVDIANAGKHIVCEKPIDVSSAKATKLIKAAKDNMVTLSVISQSRFEDDILKLKKYIREGVLGEITFGACHTKWFRSQEYYDSGDWRGTWELDGGGALMNQSVHYVDLLLFLAGPIEEVFAYCATNNHVRIEVEDIAAATIKFKNGALGFIEGNTAAIPGIERRIDIYGTKGSAVVKENILQFMKYIDENNEQIDLCGDIDNKNIVNEAGQVVSDAEQKSYFHMRQIAEVIDAINNKRPPLITGEEGWNALNVILAIYESARTGKPVKIVN